MEGRRSRRFVLFLIYQVTASAGMGGDLIFASVFSAAGEYSSVGSVLRGRRRHSGPTSQGCYSSFLCMWCMVGRFTDFLGYHVALVLRINVNIEPSTFSNACEIGFGVFCSRNHLISKS